MHEAAEMQPGGRTSLQSGSELGAESTLLFFLRGASHQKIVVVVQAAQVHPSFNH